MYDLNNVLGHIFILTLRWSGHGAENWSLITFFFPPGFSSHQSGPVEPEATLKSVCLRQAEKWYESPWVLKHSNLPIIKSSSLFMHAHTHTHKPQDTSYCSPMRSSFCSLNLASLILQILHTLLNSFLF